MTDCGIQRVSTSQRSVASEGGFRGVEHRTLKMLRDDGCRTTLTSRLALCFLTFFGVVGDVEVGSAMVAVAMAGVDVDTQRTVTLVVPRR